MSAQGRPRFWLVSIRIAERSICRDRHRCEERQARERIKARIEKAVDDGTLSEARVRVDRFNFGPPVGFPVQSA